MCRRGDHEERGPEPCGFQARTARALRGIGEDGRTRRASRCSSLMWSGRSRGGAHHQQWHDRRCSTTPTTRSMTGQETMGTYPIHVCPWYWVSSNRLAGRRSGSTHVTGSKRVLPQRCEDRESCPAAQERPMSPLVSQALARLTAFPRRLEERGRPGQVLRVQRSCRYSYHGQYPPPDEQRA
jgi:hypothetical protein